MASCIWGHRGCRGAGNPPENSLAAFAAAIAYGADGVELDLFLTRDGHLVVSHDETLERMTDGRGEVKHHTLAEIKRFRLKDAQRRPTDERVPSYDEVLNLLERLKPTTKPFVLNTEIKHADATRPVAEAIAKRLGAGWRSTDFVLSSFDMDSLRALRALNPAIPVGALFASASEPWDITLQALQECIERTRDIRPETMNITLPSMTREAARRIREAGATPVAWTSREANPLEMPVSERDALIKHIREEHIFLITDYPKEMLALIKAASGEMK